MVRELTTKRFLRGCWASEEFARQLLALVGVPYFIKLAKALF